MSPFSLKQAFQKLLKYLGVNRKYYSMAINNDCLQIRPRSRSGQSMSLKRGAKTWEAKIYGPRELYVELEDPSLSKLFTALKNAIKTEQWCGEFAHVASSGEEAFAK